MNNFSTNLMINTEHSFVVDNVYCKYFIYDFTMPVIIVFGHAGPDSIIDSQELDRSPSPWGYEYFKSKKTNIIVFSSIDEACWYQSNVFHTFLKGFSKEVNIFPERLGYGGSMGGYAISAFSNILNLTRVLLFNPLSTLNKRLVPFENRFGIDNNQKLWENSPYDGSDISTVGYVIYDPLYGLDRKHAKRYSMLTHLRLPGGGIMY